MFSTKNNNNGEKMEIGQNHAEHPINEDRHHI